MTSVRLAGVIVGVAILAGGAAFWFSPEARTTLASLVPKGSPSTKAAERHGHDHRPAGAIKLAADQIAKARIELAAVGSCTITQRVTAPGTVTPNADRVGRVAAKVVGTVAELRKRLGDSVVKGEVVAVLESREVADAKSEYLAARLSNELQQDLTARDKSLWEGRAVPEQQYLKSRTAAAQSEMRLNIARQKLLALGVEADDIAGLPKSPEGLLRNQNVRAPIDGQIVERRVDLGAPVGREGQESEIYVIADLSSLWVELSVPTSELANIAVGQPVAVMARQAGLRAVAKVIFVGPLLQADTRNARVIAAMDNASMAWRPGVFVTAQISIAEQPGELCVPRAALQTIEGEQNLFVRTDEGFEKREVVIGRSDDTNVEIVFGLDPGEVIATTRTFVLKAELGKGEAGHGHDH
ncbi:efflux RND transporter periplasmic adaptor subunit [Bradyrhizobium valentinum]|uniref:Cation transporter n=1 Tax=Bradyrhizobium valentinum TaxID=1518501 RepID=A0A0R3M3B2_9BRAD|nr:efflux RND transporter periplasmic adaptor subunit [Bradyrhizobium valentinum]KRR12389.1 cation transporter [Bradyrhizobium valentinum]